MQLQLLLPECLGTTARGPGGAIGTAGRSARGGSRRAIAPENIGKSGRSMGVPGPIHGPPRPMGGNNVSKGLGAIKNKGRLAMGLGAAVVGGLAYSGRRGEGSSGGRTGMTRY